ncbi:N-acetylmuramoyl-L-alanine amidase [Actinocorallia sp. A-T 12471]|uniref:N-acetylmuramoyl-L-alanine amidase n=1 Tax=Actinocorallia sp. A-T 12471 TaxID=3089813 RepID=UPI0029D3ACC5|nr:N-acetylmuramoyl-L-alanine amidase [Actinocorallia sp. A-T 12471]MDX6741890.1 N-acetylmuramoyl-L-alanine amidase [Actinocorallia sp. A-T 12471]
MVTGRTAIAVLGTAAICLTACGSGGGNGAAPAAPPTVNGQATESPGTPGERAAYSVKGQTIVLDPGHNGGPLKGTQVFVGNGYKACDTSGTSTNAGYTEHAFTWDVAKRTQKLLEQRGAKVFLTRDNDKGSGPCVDERAKIGNDKKAGAVISIHADGAAASGHGFHIIAPKPVPGYNEKIVKPSLRLAKDIRASYRNETGMPYATYLGDGKGLTIRDDLGGLNLSTVPKIFIETGNMRNKGDAAKLSDPKFRQKIAVSLADGLDKYFKN